MMKNRYDDDDDDGIDLNDIEKFLPGLPVRLTFLFVMLRCCLKAVAVIIEILKKLKKYSVFNQFESE